MQIFAAGIRGTSNKRIRINAETNHCKILREEIEDFALLCVADSIGQSFAILEYLAWEMSHFRLRQTQQNGDNAVQDLSRSFKVTDLSTSRKAMRLSTSQYQKRTHIWYCLPDIVDSYADVCCRDGGTSIGLVTLEKSLNGRLRNFT